MEIQAIKNIENAVIEARRFIIKATVWKRRLCHDKVAYLSGSKEGGAAKRASMDLTRSLVKLRSPWK